VEEEVERIPLYKKEKRKKGKEVVGTNKVLPWENIPFLVSKKKRGTKRQA
jgi:hypothetical protein